jgi:hypothetical protein
LNRRHGDFQFLRIFAYVYFLSYRVKIGVENHFRPNRKGSANYRKPFIYNGGAYVTILKLFCGICHRKWLR